MTELSNGFRSTWSFVLQEKSFKCRKSTLYVYIQRDADRTELASAAFRPIFRLRQVSVVGRLEKRVGFVSKHTEHLAKM